MGLRYRYRLEDISMTAPNEDLTPEQEDRRAFLRLMRQVCRGNASRAHPAVVNVAYFRRNREVWGARPWRAEG